MSESLTVTLTAIGDGPPAALRWRKGLKALGRLGLKASWPAPAAKVGLEPPAPRSPASVAAKGTGGAPGGHVHRAGELPELEVRMSEPAIYVRLVGDDGGCLLEDRQVPSVPDVGATTRIGDEVLTVAGEVERRPVPGGVLVVMRSTVRRLSKAERATAEREATRAEELERRVKEGLRLMAEAMAVLKGRR